MRRIGKFKLSLRRRIFVVVILLALVPSLIMLLAATGYGLASIRAYAIEQSQNRLFTHAERIGDQFTDELVSLRSLASAAVGGALIDGTSPGRFRLRELLDGRAAALIGPSNSVRAIAPIGLLAGPGNLDPAIVSRFASDESLLQLTAPIAIAIPGSANLWAIAPVEDRPGVAVARQLSSSELETLVELSGRADPERIVVVSQNDGILGARRDDADLTALISQTPQLMREARGVYTVNDRSGVVYTSVRVRVLPTGSTPADLEPSFVLIQAVNLDTPLAALLYRFWQLVLLGLIFLLLVAAFGVWLSKRMVDPILRLRAGFQRLEQGDLEYRVMLNTGDEIEQLARSMNRMAATLQGTYENLANKLLELDEKARQLTITYEISQAINQSLEMDALFRDIIASVRQLVVAERLVLGLVAPEGDRLERVYRWPGGTWGEIGGSLANSWTAKALSGRKVLLRSLKPGEERLESLLLGDFSQGGICIVPLVGASGRVGVLLLADKDSAAFREQEVEVLERLSPNLAMAVEHSRLYARQAEFAVELESRVQQRTAELQRAQEQLLQVEKLAAAGELAANIAHEINNPLSIIKNYMKILEGSVRGRDVDPVAMESVKEGMGIIGEEIDRIARIVEQLRRVSMPQSPDLAPVDLNEQLTLMVDLFRHTFQRKRITVETDLDPGVGTVMLSSDYLRQILINLLRNAHDALSVGGRILVESKAGLPDAGHYSVSVKDNGPGIPAEYMKKIFDPFFTTKKEGKGTGLGLSVSYGLARQMGGRIEAFSSPGQMTELRLVLPWRRPGANDEQDVVVRRQGGRIIIG